MKDTIKQAAKELKNWLTVVGYPPAYAFTNAFIVSELVNYLYPDESTSSSAANDEVDQTVYRAGLVIAFGTALAQSVAMRFYQKQAAVAATAELSGAEHHHNWRQRLEHFLGLQLYNFCFGMAGGYYAYLGDESPENNTEKLYAGLAMMAGGLLTAAGETTIHELYLQETHQDGGNLATALYQYLVTDIAQQADSLSTLKTIWFHWGTFLSHICAGGFGVGAAVDALGLLLFEDTAPLYIKAPIAWTLGTVGAMVHTNSELQALKKSQFSGTLGKILEIENTLQKFLILLFLGSAFLFSVFHPLPEAVALPEIFTPEGFGTLERFGIACAFAVVLGIPDMITFWPLVLEAAAKLFLGRHSDPLFANNSAVSTSSVSCLAAFCWPSVSGKNGGAAAVENAGMMYSFQGKSLCLRLCNE